MYTPMKILHGIPVVIDEPVPYEIKTKRGWKERWFTLPFKPLEKYKTTTEYKTVVEDGQVIQANGSYVMTEKTWKALYEITY